MRDLDQWGNTRPIQYFPQQSAHPQQAPAVPQPGYNTAQGPGVIYTAPQVPPTTSQQQIQTGPGMATASQQYTVGQQFQPGPAANNLPSPLMQPPQPPVRTPGPNQAGPVFQSTDQRPQYQVQSTVQTNMYRGASRPRAN